MRTSKAHLEEELTSTLKTLKTSLVYALQISQELREHTLEPNARVQSMVPIMLALLVELLKTSDGPPTK